MNIIELDACKDCKSPRIYTVFTAAASVIFALFFSVMLFFKLYDSDSALFIALLSLLIGFVAYCIINFNKLSCMSVPIRNTAIVLGIAAVFILQLYFGKAIAGAIAYDFQYVFYTAKTFVNEGTMGENVTYFAQFPNNVFLMLVFANVFRICNFLSIAYEPALIAMNIAAVDLTIVLTYLCSRKMFGKRTAIACLVFIIPMLGFHRGIMLPYSDTLCMPFYMLALFIYLNLPKCGHKRWIYIALISLSIVIGYRIKPQAVIILVAIIIIEILRKKWSRERLLSILKAGLCLCLAAIIFSSFISLYENFEVGEFITDELKEEYEISAAHYLMMGLNPDTGGLFSSEDYEATLSHYGKSAKTKYNFEEAANRIKNLGFAGYIGFIIEKHREVFSSAHMDVWIREPFAFSDSLSVAIRGFTYHEYSGYLFYKNIIQAIWIVMYFFMIVPVIFNFKCRNKCVSILRLTLLGFVLFLTLFEAGSRYILHQIPVFCMLSAWGMCNSGLGDALKNLFDRFSGIIFARRPKRAL